MKKIEVLDKLNDNINLIDAYSDFLSSLSVTANDSKTNPNTLSYLSLGLYDASLELKHVLTNIEKMDDNSATDSASKSLQDITDIAGYLDDKMDEFEETAKYALDGSTTTVNGEVQPPSYDWRQLARLANEIAVAEDIEYNKEN